MESKSGQDTEDAMPKNRGRGCDSPQSDETKARVMDSTRLDTVNWPTLWVYILMTACHGLTDSPIRSVEQPWSPGSLAQFVGWATVATGAPAEAKSEEPRTWPRFYGVHDVSWAADAIITCAGIGWFDTVLRMDRRR
ncbi:hypothetical protein GGTG_04480 [Gaeumannomyces tritici R3-111a-1]|uniref:Uncharacterized protein n=1 Tax=Gaeumannomyces tritici (strain R3-111a-1) TaxID=644352 RepID=J3NT81_GAET3|nr:hypothetical protein GGTG_04480 [Gaeumannomyces tritici R3-111a-1]EJT79396.1 hypothetical protein GGTG_04480 [Gaeumannomyces tritici R3-111a-1]